VQFGVNDPRYADALGPLAKVYFVQGRYAEAEALYKHVLPIRKSTFRLDMVQTLNGLAEV
jgi:hypothetical protein